MFFDFCFGTACGAIMFAVATGTTFSCSLGRLYRPVLSLSFLDVYGLRAEGTGARWGWGGVGGLTGLLSGKSGVKWNSTLLKMYTIV